MAWAGAAPLLDILERWRGRGWVVHDGGGIQVGHTPAVAPLAYLHTVYPGLDDEHLDLIQEAYGKPLPAEYRAFLGWANGARLFGSHFGLRGSSSTPAGEGLIDRSGRGLGQPVSLRYGNTVERPRGIPGTAWAVGVLSGWSGQGELVLLQNGEVVLCSKTDFDDVAARWPSLTDLVLNEARRMSALTGDDGEWLAPAAEFLPSAARRWETDVGPGLG